MTPFLQQVARAYLDVNHLEDHCFVFPNRRSGEFFTHYLQQEFVAVAAHGGGATPHLMPRVTSINDLVAEFTGTVAASDIEMIFALYDAYCEVMGASAQEFDKFIYWAQLIISDFNDIDRALADAREIYRNLEDLHDLRSNYLSAEVKEKVQRIFGDSLFTAFFDTDVDASLWSLLAKDQKNGNTDEQVVKEEFLNLWNALPAIYDTYHDKLNARQVVSPGRQLRLAVEAKALKVRYDRMVFVGFGVLSAAEVELFKRFGDKADYWWDNAGLQALLQVAPHDPGALLIDGYCRTFGARQLEPLQGDGPELRVVAVPSTVGQAKQAFDEVERMLPAHTRAGLETAVVLPDEGLLVPLLHSVHGVDRLNVTLGYPLRSSGIVSLMHIVARMHHQASKERGAWTYYREDVYDILSHPLIKTYFTDEALAKVTDLTRANRFRVPASEFEGLGFSDLFVPVDGGADELEDRLAQRGYLDHLLAFGEKLMAKMQPADDDDVEDFEDVPDVSDLDGVPVSLQQAFLMMYIDVLHQLRQELATCSQSLKHSTVFYLIDRLTATAIVPFTGEPLRGLQIMGLLETRSLDFERVVILSMNERIFPRRRSINSFIPNYMRRAHGMSTVEQQEAIVAYNFYRLMNRSRQVTLIYDSSDQSLGSSEPSRYITQLEMIYGHRIEQVVMNPVIRTSSLLNIDVPNPGFDTLRQLYLSRRDYAKEWFLSASAINKYINCPLAFYMHYIQGLNDDNELSDFMDYTTFGSIVHDVLSEFYGSRLNQAVKVDEIKAFQKSGLDNLVKRYIKKHFLHVPDNRLASDDTPLTGEAFMLVDTIKSYVNFVLDYDKELIAQSGPFTVLECEKPHVIQDLEMHGERFNFTFTPDRIDRLQDGTVRIVDYKTGRDATAFSTMDDLFDPLKNNASSADSRRRKAILQLFLYCYAYLIEHPEEHAVMPMIYKIPQMDDSGVKQKQGRGAAATSTQYVFRMDEAMAVQFVERMSQTIHALYNSAFTQAAEESYECNHCKFIDFCRRTPVKKF